jgi:hypothetical protein
MSNKNLVVLLYLYNSVESDLDHCLSFSFWPLRCLSFFDLRILMINLVSSNRFIPETRRVLKLTTKVNTKDRATQTPLRIDG